MVIHYCIEDKRKKQTRQTNGWITPANACKNAEKAHKYIQVVAKDEEEEEADRRTAYSNGSINYIVFFMNFYTIKGKIKYYL